MTDKCQYILTKMPEIEENPLRITRRISAEIVDMVDNTIVDACVKEARKAGITDLYLLDRKFVLDALREKAQRTQQKEE